MSAKMLQEAIKIINSTPIGGTYTCQAGADITLIAQNGHETNHPPAVADLERFQPLVEELDRYHSVGVIEILLRHHESQTGKRLVDLVKFKRIG